MVVLPTLPVIAMIVVLNSSERQTKAAAVRNNSPSRLATCRIRFIPSFKRAVSAADYGTNQRDYFERGRTSAGTIVISTGVPGLWILILNVSSVSSMMSTL